MKPNENTPPRDDEIEALLARRYRDTSPEFEARWVALKRELRQAPDWQRLIGAGARPQKLLWASTGTKDPGAPDTLYVEALAAPDTINTIPDSTLLAFAAHGRLAGTMPADGGDCEQVIAQFNAAGVDEVALAARLQRDGAAAFVKSWQHLLGQLAGKAAAVGRAGVHA